MNNVGYCVFITCLGLIQDLWELSGGVRVWRDARWVFFMARCGMRARGELPYKRWRGRAEGTSQMTPKNTEGTKEK